MIANLTVRFQPDVWASLSAEEQQSWLDGVVDAVNTHAYVSDIQITKKEES